MLRVLFFLQTAFSLWMLVDALRRGAAYHWYLVIMLPFGEWIYFFMVKIHDPQFEWARQLYARLTTRKVTVEELRFQADQSPSFTSKITLAPGLYDRGSYREAADLFAEALRLDGESRDALYGQALAHSALGEYPAAARGFQQVIELDPSYRDYAAYGDLAHALSEDGRLSEAHDLLERLVTASPRLRHRVMLAHYLLRDQRNDEAAEQLRTGLHEYDHAPRYVKRRQRIWARRARQMLKQVS